MPVFWGYLDHPYYWPVRIGSQVKTRQSQNYKFKEFAKTSNVWILKKKKKKKKKNILHTTHLLELLDKMYKYQMDLASIVEDTKQTRFCPKTDKLTYGRMDRWTDGQGETSIPPFNFVERGYKYSKLNFATTCPWTIIINNWSLDKNWPCIKNHIFGCILWLISFANSVKF